MDEVTVRPLVLADAHHLAPLLAAYAQHRKRGAPGAPDEYYAELLLKDPVAEIVGAWRGGRLVGFAVYLDLPDPMSGLRAGQLDDLFVAHEAADRGVGRLLADAIVAEGEKRGWPHLRWMVPEQPPSVRRIAEKVAEPGRWQSYIIRIERKGGG